MVIIDLQTMALGTKRKVYCYEPYKVLTFRTVHYVLYVHYLDNSVIIQLTISRRLVKNLANV